MWRDDNLKLFAVPVVMVFTKLDQLDEEIRIVIDDGNPDAEPHVKDLLVKDEIKSVLHSNYLEPIRRYMGKEKFPHVKVSGKNSPRAQPLTLRSD